MINKIISNYTVDKGLDLAIYDGPDVETSGRPESELEVHKIQQDALAGAVLFRPTM